MAKGLMQTGVNRIKGKRNLDQFMGDVAALTRSSLICWENNTPNNKTMDPSPENIRAAWYQGPMKLEVVKSCGDTAQLMDLSNLKGGPW